MDNKPKLTAKQEMFCREYLIDLNATQAAIRAGYSPDTARQIGTENLAKPVIKEYIQAELDKKSKELSITVDDVLRDLIETRKLTAEEGKHSDRTKVNELLGKYLKMWTDKHEHTGADGKDLQAPVFNFIRKSDD